MVEINKMLKIFRKTEIAKRYSREVGSVWKETTTCEIEKRIGIRWNAAVQYQKDIKEALKSDVDVDVFLINEFNYITIDTYFNEIWKACENFDFSEIKEYNIWSEIFYLFFLHSKEMAQYEKELYDDSDVYMERCKEMYKHKVIRNDYYMEKGVMPQEDPNDEYSATGSFTRFYDLYEKSERSEFLLCRKLFNVPDKHSNIVDEIHQLIANIELLCLYIALDNEKDRLKTLAKFSNFAQKDTKSAPQAKKTKQPREVFTERATKYFEKAEKEGYLEKVGDKYEWLYRGGKVALVYFFIRIYEPESPPYEQLEPVFGVKYLTSSRSNLVNSIWYKDELKRQKMTSEELKLEERKHELRKPSSWFPELKNFFD